MINFIQPLGTVLLGLAMLAYGSIQTALHRPSGSSFQAAAQAMPDAIAVIAFAFGIAAVVVGIVLLVSGVKGVRRRTREIGNAYGRRRLSNHSSRNECADDWDDEMYPAYR
ncbi:MAG: hypothetical protein AAGI37_03870 [Planctomycetota bacterium]